MRIAVTGATGFIGRELCQALASRGDEVTVLTRHPDRARSHVPAGSRVVAWDAVSALPAGALDGVSAVVNLAGEPIVGLWTLEKKRRIVESRVTTTRRVVEALAASVEPPRVLVSGSAVGYYGDRGDEVLTEDSASGSGFLPAVCRVWEAEAHKAEQYGVRVTCLRTGLVLGTSGGILPVMLLPFRLGLGAVVGSGRQWMSWVHVADEVGLIVHAIDRDVSGALNAVAPNPVTNAELSRTVADELGRPLFLQVPAPLLRLATGELADLLLHSERAISDRAQRTGYAFQHPTLQEALRTVLQPAREASLTGSR